MLGFYALNEQALNSLPGANQALDPFALKFSTLLKEAVLPDPYAADNNYNMIHPGICYFPDGWNGWKYWIIYTPFPGDIYKENPCIAVSNDAETWQEPVGFTNPLVSNPSEGGFNADTDIFYDEASDQLVAVWKAQALLIDSESRTQTRMSVTSDGVNWSTPVAITDDLSSVNIPATASLNYNPDTALYELITINAASADQANPDYDLWTSSTLTGTYTIQQQVNIPCDTGKHWWNLYIKRLPDGSYVGMGQDTDAPSVNGDGSLFWLKSNDGITFERQLAMRAEKLYRCAFTLEPDNGVYKAFIAGSYPDAGMRICDLDEIGYVSTNNQDYVSDSFDRADSLNVGNPELGPPLLTVDTEFDISGNSLVTTGPNRISSRPKIVWEAGIAECELEFQFEKTGNTVDELWFIGRYSDDNNFIRIGFYGEIVRYQEMLGGTLQTYDVVSELIPQILDDSLVKLEFGADYVAMSVDGSPFFHYPTTDQYGATGFGLQTTHGDLRILDFSIAGQAVVVEVGAAAGSGTAQSVTPILPIEVDVGSVVGSGQAQSVTPLNGYSGIAFLLYQNFNDNNALRGDFPLGTAPAVVGGQPTALEYTLPIPVDAIWVEFGYVGTESGTEAQPYSTLRAALNATTNGQGAHIVIKNAVINVTSANRADWLINEDDAIPGTSVINSGAGWAASHTDRSNMITIRAQTPFGVRFVLSGAPGTGGYQSYFVNLQTAQYVSVDGFIIELDESWGQSAVHGIEVNNHCYITRCIVKKAADGQDGSWFSASGSDNLFEMCYGVGAARYGFRAGGANSSEKRNVWRLCVGRHDTSTAGQPNATFAWYGNNGGNTTGFGAWLNCIAVDGQYIGPGSDAGNHVRWGSWYWVKRVTDMFAAGCISLNEGFEYAAFVQANVYSGCFNTRTENCIMWDAAASSPAHADGLRINADSANNNTGDSLTIGNMPDQFESHGYSPLTNSRTSDTLNGTDKSVVYQSDGADARYVYGSLGQRYGDAGYDVVTATPAFPFPYEDTIKTVFTEQVDTASGHTPAGNVSNRGFCQSTSLTDYIIKYEDGTTTIEEVYS